MLTILVVDDSKTLRFALSKMIERMGHRSVVASNGEEALELFKRERPGLVMLDVLMPDMDGYSVARAMRSYRVDDWVPIIFLSAKEDDQDLERGIEAGGDDYLVKPVSYVVLNAKIRAMQRIDDMRQRLLHLSNELAQANMELEIQSHQDGLTTLANRRFFDSRLAQEISRLRRSKGWLSLILCDVDHFKKYNDGYGHIAGDECLQTVADALRNTCQRPTDIVARYGGEEFAIILPETDPAGAEIVGRNLVRNVAARAIPHAYSPTSLHVTTSAGIASVLVGHDLTNAALILRADEALYQAKQAGRNRYFIYAANQSTNFSNHPRQ